MLVAVAVAAVFVVAFLNSSPLWSSVIVTLTLFILAIAAISIYLYPNARPFLICALMMGLIYLAAAFVRPLGFSDSLITTHAIFEWWYVGQAEDIQRWIVDPGSRGGTKGAVFTLLNYEAAYFDDQGPAGVLAHFQACQRIGHCAVALILAVIAGLIGSYVARKRQAILHR
jgi:hypothetical protein